MEPNRLSSTTFFIFLFTFTIASAVLPALAVDSRYSNCSLPLVCGRHNYSRTYPFWGAGKNEYCGRPGFELKCRGRQDLLLETGGQTLRVLNLSQSGTITMALDSLWSDDCPRTFVFPESGFKYFEPPSLQNISLYDCDTPQPVPSFSCRSSTYYIRLSSEPSANFGDCEWKIDIPIPASVPESVFEQSRNPLGIFKQGFNLTYADDDTVCEACSKSEGICGWDQETEKFQCFCRDKPHEAVCGLKGDNVNYKRKVIIAVVASVTSGLAVCAACYFFQRRKNKIFSASSRLLSRISSSYTSSKGSDIEKGGLPGVQCFTYEELEEATGNFNPSKELGDGGFGTVYHGVLRDRREVAVKRLHENNYRRAEQFLNEVEILTRLRHINLVSLYGCTSRSCRELLLVYEYISNGTLADHLHGCRCNPGFLPWPLRVRISIETARALTYLHSSGIIHRDVKTNNILLDGNFSVKVADFGLSRLFPQGRSHVSTAPQGTPGYVDPEYHHYYQLTVKSDVFSFGVVLVELISSMPAVDITRRRDEINLSSMAVKKIRDRALQEFVDSSLGFASDETVRESVTAVAELAFQCLQGEKEMRPSMAEVLEALERIQRQDSDEDHKGQGGTKTPGSDGGDDMVLLKKGVRLVASSPDTVMETWHSSRSSS